MADVTNSATVAGKQVTFRRRVTLKEGHNLPTLFREASQDDCAGFVPLCQLMIEPCELVPDPKDEEAYNSMDTFDALALRLALIGYMNQRFTEAVASVS